MKMEMNFYVNKSYGNADAMERLNLAIKLEKELYDCEA